MLTGADERRVFQALGECLELWDDPDAWLSHVLDSVTTLSGTDISSLILAKPHPHPLKMTWRDRKVFGLDADIADEFFYKVSIEDVPDMPGADLIMRDLAQVGRSTRTLAQLGGFEHFRRTQSYERVHEHVELGAYAAFFRPLPTQPTMIVATIARRRSSRSVSLRGVAVASRIFDELESLVGNRLATFDQPSRYGLSPRLVQTLDGLLDGLSEKQIAIRLKLSRLTVHQYVGVLYRHFGVESRGEMMSYFVKRRPGGT
jgi:DNA-binding CsgD family transcriptional regulator